MKRFFKIGFAFSIMISVVIGLCNVSHAASTSKEDSLKEILENQTSIDTSNLDIGQVLAAYNELSETYTNQEIANMLEEHKDELQQYGVTTTAVEAGAKVLRSVDTKELNNILKNDLNLNEIQTQLSNGATPEEVISNVQKQMSPMEKLNVFAKVLWSSLIIKVMATIMLVLFLYETILKWIIFHKAGKNGFAAIIPIYRQVTMLKVCGLSPWWLLLLFVPIIGWFILGIIGIVMKFRLSFGFNRGVGFGFGLFFFEIIFESILAFNPKIQYIGFEE